MISIIISSADSKLLSAVKENIASTIGVPFEVISFANENGRSGICELYNKGIGLSKYDLLCFMHEDIFFHTNDWGKVVIDTFNNDGKIGILGVAGSYYKALTPSGAAPLGINTECINLIQHYKYEEHRQPFLNYQNPFNTAVAEVVCVDGVWFCTLKSIAEKHRFDEHNFTGFHCYDQDFSLSVGINYKIAVTYNILIAHHSEGNFNKSWLSDVLKLHKKWDSTLPVNYGGITGKQSVYMEKVTYKHLLEQLNSFNMPLFTAFKVLWRSSFRHKFSLKFFIKLNYYAFREYLHRLL